MDERDRGRTLSIVITSTLSHRCHLQLIVASLRDERPIIAISLPLQGATKNQPCVGRSRDFAQKLRHRVIGPDFLYNATIPRPRLGLPADDSFLFLLKKRQFGNAAGA